MTNAPDYNDTTFQKHYREHYALTGRPYSDYQSAYRYGWDKACEGTYRGHQWGEVVERDLRSAWQHRESSLAWPDIHEAVHEGYEQGHRSMLT